MSTDAPPAVKAAAGDLFQTVADETAKREAIRTQALADAWDRFPARAFSGIPPRTTTSRLR